MKKILVCSLILLLVISGYAQETAKGLKLSCNAGCMLSNMIGKGCVDNAEVYGGLSYYTHYTNASAGRKFLAGYKFGLGIAFDFTQIISLDLDINYEEKGCLIPVNKIWLGKGSFDEHGNYEEDYVSVKAFSKIRLRYFVVPIKTEIRYKMFYVAPGIYTAFLVDAQDYGAFHLKNQEIIINTKRTWKYSFLDFGVLLNIGIAVPLSLNDFLKIGIGGAWNITNIKKREGKRFDVVEASFYNQSYSLEVKYERKIK
jgi:hypothetical protein